MRVLLVESVPEPTPASSIVSELLAGRGHEVVPLDLRAEGFDRFMSEAERRAYHEEDNLVTAEQRRSVELVRSVDALVLVSTLREGTLDPVVKSWFERVFIPGVSFTFTPAGRITAALRNIKRIGMVLECPDDDVVPHRRVTGPRSVVRAVRLNAARTCRTTYLALAPETDRRSAVELAFKRW
ncbi:MAG: NAD(P)H-dependent oxidoreductase [Actinomycetota bacterium]